MPLYDFRCQSCGHSFEVLTAWSRKGEVCCPKCGAASPKELPAAVAMAGGGEKASGAAPVRRGFS